MAVEIAVATASMLVAPGAVGAAATPPLRSDSSRVVALEAPFLQLKGGGGKHFRARVASPCLP
jgi:hypothetical protein